MKYFKINIFYLDYHGFAVIFFSFVLAITALISNFLFRLYGLRKTLVYKVFFLIFIAFAIFATWFVWPTNSQKQPQFFPNEMQEAHSGWLVYDNVEAGFKVNYPSDWKLGEVDESNEDYKRISLSGNEGEILFDWGHGFGGYCEKLEKINIKNDQMDVCNGTDQEGRKTISIFAREWGSIGVGGFAFVNKPIMENEKIIYQILSTLEFYNRLISPPVVPEISWEECAISSKSIIQYSDPAKCVTPDGRRALQPLYELLKSRSSGYIYFPDLVSSFYPTPLVKVKVYLYAQDETISKVENVYCGAPVAGKMIYKGHYQLILDDFTLASDNLSLRPHIKLKDTTIDLGLIEFVEGSHHDGQIIIDQLDPNGYENFIIIYTYGSCNSETIRVYGYNLNKSSLELYKFKNKDGKVNDGVCLSPTLNFPAKPLVKSREGNLITRCYSQITGKNEVSEWKFVPEKEEFQEIRHSQESS